MRGYDFLCFFRGNVTCGKAKFEYQDGTTDLGMHFFWAKFQAALCGVHHLEPEPAHWERCPNHNVFFVFFFLVVVFLFSSYY